MRASVGVQQLHDLDATVFQTPVLGLPVGEYHQSGLSSHFQ